MPDPTALVHYGPRSVTCRACREETPLPALRPGIQEFKIYHADACPVLQFARLNTRGLANTDEGRQALREALAMAQEGGRA